MGQYMSTRTMTSVGYGGRPPLLPSGRGKSPSIKSARWAKSMCRAMICKGSPRLSILRLRASSANRSNFRALRGSGMATQAGEKMRVRGGGFLEVPARCITSRPNVRHLLIIRRHTLHLCEAAHRLWIALK